MPAAAQLGVEEGHLDRTLGHPVALDVPQGSADTGRREVGPAAQRRHQMVADHQGRRRVELAGVERRGPWRRTRPSPHRRRSPCAAAAPPWTCSVPNDVWNGERNGSVDPPQLDTLRLHSRGSLLPELVVRPSRDTDDHRPSCGHQAAEARPAPPSATAGPASGSSTRMRSMSSGTWTNRSHCPATDLGPSPAFGSAASPARRSGRLRRWPGPTLSTSRSLPWPR